MHGHTHAHTHTQTTHTIEALEGWLCLLLGFVYVVPEDEVR